MAFSLVQHVPAKDDAGSANGSVTISAATAGNIIVVTGGFRTTAALVTDPGGYTRRTSKDDAGTKTAILIEKIAAGGETAIAFTHASCAWSIEAYEFSGNEVSGSEFDAAAAGANGSGTSIQPGSITPAVANELFVACVEVGGDNGGSEAVDSSFTLEDAATFTTFFSAFKISGGSGAENPTFSWTTSRGMAAIMATFKPLTAGQPILKRSLEVPFSTGFGRFPGGFHG